MTRREPNSADWRRTASCTESKLIAAFLFLCLLFAPRLIAQDSQPDSYAGLEGQKVSKVDVSAKPDMDIASLRSLIQQKAGTPLSIQAIRESVAALQKNKSFSRIQVSITPDESGLNVLFILQPTSYIGVLDFPGALKAFAYPQLLQAANIPEQAPYVESLPEQGTRALLHFFETNGYFEAKVSAAVERDDPHRIVNIRFDCHLGRLARIGELNISGLPDPEAKGLRQALETFWATLKGASLKSGKKYSQQRLSKSLDFVTAHLRKQNRLASSLRFNPPTYHAETGRADLNLQVEAGPRLSVKVTGARISMRTIHRLIPVYEENTVDQDLVDEGRRNLLSYFQSKGYFDARIESRMDRQQDSVSVVYEVDRKEKHQVEAVSFQGNHFLSDKQLSAVVAVSKGRSIFGHFFSHGKYSAELVRKSVDAITAAYKDAGFADARVIPEVSDYDPRIDLTLRITEGEQYKVNTFTFNNDRTSSGKSIVGNRRLNLAPGRPYSPSLLQQDRDRIVARYENQGYANAEFHSSVTPTAANPHLVDVVYSVDAGPQEIVSSVAILGTKTTNNNFITEVTKLKVTEGKPVSLGNILTSESDLYGLGTFDWASIKTLEPPNNQTQQEVLIKVHESPRNSVDFGGGFEVIPRSGNIPVGTVALPGIPPIGVGSKFTASQTSYWGPRASFEYGRHNIRGRAETATFGLVYSRLDQRASLTYANPRLSGSSWSSLFSLSAERSTQISIYTAELEQASFQVEKAFDTRRTKNLILRYGYQHTLLTNITIPDLVLPADQRVRLSTFSAQYVRDTRDKPLDAHHGIYQTANVAISPAALGSSASFVRFSGQTAFYKPITPWLTWANNFRIGIAKPFAGADVPLSERFFSGGADSLRGFPINGSGPQRPVTACGDPANPSTCTLISVPIGGNMLAIVNSEARFPIPVKSGLGGVVFYDGGNVYASTSLRQFADNYTHTIGFGFRYQTPVGPIRVDIGRRLTNVPGVNATQYFVTLGQSF